MSNEKRLSQQRPAFSYCKWNWWYSKPRIFRLWGGCINHFATVPYCRHYLSCTTFTYDYDLTLAYPYFLSLMLPFSIRRQEVKEDVVFRQYQHYSIVPTRFIFCATGNHPRIGSTQSYKLRFNVLLNGSFL